MEQSDLFESEVHLAEICDIMAIAVEGIYNIYSITGNSLKRKVAKVPLSSLYSAVYTISMAQYVYRPCYTICSTNSQYFVVLCDFSAISPSLSSELPSLLPVVPVTEALLRLRNGPRLLTCLVGNMPDQLDHGVQFYWQELPKPSLSVCV